MTVTIAPPVGTEGEFSGLVMVKYPGDFQPDGDECQLAADPDRPGGEARNMSVSLSITKRTTHNDCIVLSFSFDEGDPV